MKTNKKIKCGSNFDLFQPKTNDIKSYQNYIYIGTEANFPDPTLYEEGEYYVQPQGIQVVDLTNPSTIYEEEKIDKIVVSYLNRLSDNFFVWSRWVAMILKHEENTWDPNKGSSGN